MTRTGAPHDTRIETATPADAPALARLHVQVWRETYGALAPRVAIDLLDCDRRLAYWHKALANTAPGAGTLIASRGRAVTGFVAVAAATHPMMGRAGEIRHLYVAKPARGHGLGAALLRLALARIAEAGWPGAALAVVRENHAARRFYAAHGGVEAGGFTDPGPLWRSDNVLIRWRPDQLSAPSAPSTVAPPR